MLSKAVVSSLVLVGLTTGAAVDTQVAPVAGDQSPNNREGKFFSVFQIVKFKNGQCTTDTGDYGTCYTEAECAMKGGMAGGPCASQFGVCCKFMASECGATVQENNAYITNPGYPSMSPSGMCMFNIQKCDSDICQYKLHFEDVMLSSPMMGDCTNDTMSISNVDGPSQSTVPPALCGTLTGQTMHVIVKAQTDPAKIVFNVAQMGTSKYKIRVEQLNCSSDMLAPAGCLTYNTGLSGSFSSYNYDNGMGEYINNQKFSHCIKYQDGYCDMSMTSSKFDVGTAGDNGDSLTVGNQIFTGSAFGSSGMLTWNFTGPYVIPVTSDAMNAASNMGYEISYLLLPC